MDEVPPQPDLETAADNPAPAAPPPLPERLHLNELHGLTHARLLERAASVRLRVNPERTRHQLVLDLLKFYGKQGVELIAEGVLEIGSDQQAFLRWPRFNFKPFPEDVFVPRHQVQRLNLQPGLLITARIRPPRDNKERWMVLDTVIAIEEIPLEQWVEPKPFENLTPLFPDRRLILENNVTRSLSARAVDLITPLGRGQRALIVAPPRGGKTMMMKDMARSIRASSPETHVILLLIDERPEEVTDLKREVNADVFSSTFDENPQRHVQVAELVLERAKRLVELKRDVVIMLDSITRLARAYNNLMPNKGRIMSGGVDAKALIKPKKFFGAARNVEEGGSLTILATALIDTNSRMDEVIFEEFKGTGNMELHLARELVEKRIFPAIHILNSGTRREDLLYHPEEFARISLLRKQLAQLPPIEAMEILVRQLRNTKTNAELLLTGLRSV
ncbi:MAG TPA: transcription termination factor Rho [Chthoniobacteraceae bacterium]|nr:transcription termination factor Rho [Chthoniobacteraceae bacterium]